MITQDILNKIRADLRDIVGTDTEKKWSDEEVINDYANDAQDKLSEKCFLLEDYDTVGENLATGKVTLTAGTVGQIDSVTVNGITITSGAVPFDTTLTKTATNLAANIIAYASIPNYTATSIGQVVTIAAVAGTGSNPNGFVVIVTTSGGLTATDIDMAGGYALTKIYLLANKASYDLHPKTLTVIRAKLAGLTSTLAIMTRKELDIEIGGNWENLTGTPEIIAPNVKMKKVVFVPSPTAAVTCTLGVQRYPLIPMSIAQLNKSPEVAEEYHKYLFNWIYHRCFIKTDAETLDTAMAGLFLQKFLDDVETIKINEIRRDNYQRVCGPLNAFT